MNLKPTLWKVIVSIVVGLIIGFFLTVIVTPECFPATCINWIPMVTSPIVIYILWSLIQKK